jgi:S-adenosylmethionine:tRNA-ribosyltransferase-isomerase (queuine synthetase)
LLLAPAINDCNANFHLPKSTLFMLIGRDVMQAAHTHAIALLQLWRFQFAVAEIS